MRGSLQAGSYSCEGGNENPLSHQIAPPGRRSGMSDHSLYRRGASHSLRTYRAWRGEAIMQKREHPFVEAAVTFACGELIKLACG